MNRAWLLGLLAVVVVSPLIVVVLIVSAILLSPLAIMLSTACTCVIACLVFTGVLWVFSSGIGRLGRLSGDVYFWFRLTPLHSLAAFEDWDQNRDTEGKQIVSHHCVNIDKICSQYSANQGRLRYTYSNSQWFSEPNDLVTSTLMSAMHHLAYTLFQMAYKVQEQLLKGASITALLKSRVLFLQKLAAHNRRKMAAWVISVAGTPLLTRDLPVEIILEVGQGTACDCQTEYRDIDRIRHHAPDLWEMWWRLPSNVLSKLH